MICPQCGAEVADGSAFCPNCGATLNAAAASDQASNTNPIPNAAPNLGAVPGQMPYTAPNPMPAPAPAAPKGCLGQGWSDITGSPDWVKRVLVLMVMKAIPVLGFFASGYNLKWGAAAARGDNGWLPKGSFGKLEIKAGVLYFVLTALSGIATFGCSFLLVGIPVLGTIASVIIALLFGAITLLAVLRMAMFDKFGEAFELSDCIAAFRRKPGQLIAAAVVPGVIVSLIAGVLMLIIFSVTASSSLSSLSYLSYGLGFSSSSNSLLSVILSILSLTGIAGTLVMLLTSLLSGFAELWSTRAVGIWVQRYVPEWPRGEKVPVSA